MKHAAAAAGGGAVAAPMDKYEQMLARYDWHSERPPRQYQYGVGRGAKAFVTSGELATGMRLATVGVPTAQENDFFAALDRLEEKPGKKARERHPAEPADTDAPADTAALTAKPKLSLDDLSAIGASSVASGLTLRSARTEAVDSAEEYLFSDERGLTIHDLLRGKNSASQHNLQSLLEMGSPEEQSTWITHARAYRELGMLRKAQQTLAEGCALTGKQGALIWEERLSYLDATSDAARRRVLEDATAACPREEGLWLLVLDCQPPHERLSWLQRAVIACPTSERLWLRVIATAPDRRDQKRILTKALQHTQDLPLLWAKLARLETSRETGRAIFAAAARKFPSFALVVEAAKYAEWSAAASLGTAPPTPREAEAAGPSSTLLPAADAPAAVTAARASMHRDIRTTVRLAAHQYLDATDPTSRRRWIEAAQSICALNGRPPTELMGPAGAGSAAQRYVWAAAYMLLALVRPQPVTSLAAAGASMRERATPVPPTWLEDALSFLHRPWASHGTLCALWGTWLLLTAEGAEAASASFTLGGEPSGRQSSSGDGHAFVDVPPLLLSVLSAAIASAPPHVLETALREAALPTTATGPHSVLGEPPSSDTVVKREPPAEEDTEALGSHPVTSAASAQVSAPRQRVVPSPVSATYVAKQEADAHTAVKEELAAEQKAPVWRAEEDCLPLPLSAVLRETFHAVAAAGAGGAASIDLLLTLAKALYDRHQLLAALHVLQLAQPDTVLAEEESASRAAAAPADDRLVVATAKTMAALGRGAEADLCLARAVAAVSAHAPAADASSHELLWVKLAVHRRSSHPAAGEVEALLVEAVQHCPRSARLWLMRLEEARARVCAAATTAGPHLTAPLSLSEAARQELRRLYTSALAPQHCRGAVAVWVFVAVRLESECLHSAATARALLLDAAMACTAGAGARAAAAGEAAEQQRQRSGAAVALGLARVRVELRHAGAAQALELVRETLQRLPKTREGTFTVPAGELLSLYIDLEGPAMRGRAAAQVTTRWNSRESLVLLSVAKLYHAAGQHRKALEQALRAVTVDAKDNSRGICGDCAALLWKLAALPEYDALVAAKLGIKSKASDNGGSATGPSTESGQRLVSESEVRQWVLSVLHRCGRADDDEGDEDDEAATSAAAAPADRGEAMSFETLHISSGPLWVEVAKASDPTNVTLLGYRDSIESMLQRVAQLIPLEKAKS